MPVRPEPDTGTRGGDEINIARKGRDYGWPTIAYGIEYRGGPITGGITQQAGMEHGQRDRRTRVLAEQKKVDDVVIW